MESASTEDLNNTSQSTMIKKKPKKLPIPCKICGALAIYSYCSIVVCPSCKVFFKRNAETKKGRFKCIYSDHCEIDILNRHICTSCRLEKCFASGMQVVMLRASRTPKDNASRKRKITAISTVSITEKEKDEPQQLPTLNLLRSDQSTLTIDQWNLLSNLTHCYDEYSGVSLAQCFIREQNQLPPKRRFKIASVGQLFTSLLGQGQLLYEKNADFISLCPHDRSLVLHKTMKYVAGLGSCLVERYTRVLDNPGFYESAETIYGLSTLANNNRAIDLLDCDDTFVKLVLAILIFSTFDYTCYTNNVPDNLNNTKAVIRIHDMYVDLTWRYSIYKHGHERAVICFSKLIRCLFSFNNFLVEAVENKQYTDMIDSLIQRTEETLMLTE